MPHDRFFYVHPFSTGQRIALDDEEAHHLIRVMRAKPGDLLEIVNGNGQLASAKVEAVDRRKAILVLEAVTQSPAPKERLILAQAIPRPNRLDTIVEKCTELGMTDLWLFPGERSERRELSNQQLSRAHAQAIAALKQCGRLFLPHIEVKPPLKQWTQLPFPCYFGDVSPQAFSLQAAWQASKPKQVICVIGPEAGLSPREEEILRELQGTGVRLHPNILRTDTAAIVALSLLSHWVYHVPL